MSQLRSALTRNPIIFALLSSFAAILLIVACDRAGENGSGRSRSFEARTDTVIVRDTIVVVDTMVVEKEIVKSVALVDTVLVEKEVEKRVNVPAEIPERYLMAWKKYVAEVAAGFADEKMCFTGLNSLQVVVSLNKTAQDILSNQRAKDKFELTLRRHGVPLTESTNPYLALSIEALWNKEKTLAVFTISASLMEPLFFYRGNEPHMRYVPLWEETSYGYTGKDVARDGFLGYIEEKAERVANLYLSAN